jgi:outer membrane protein assembly factor BamB
VKHSSHCRTWIAACLLFVIATLARADNWPQWRGPENNGHSKEKGLPITWDEKTNIAWTLPMPGPGGSTPVIWGDRIFLTSADGAELVLLCVKTDGKQLWKSRLANVGRESVRNGEGNDASPSCSTDGKHVFTFIGTYDLACFDFDGKEIWKFNIQARYGPQSIQHGMHVTPLLHEDRLYLALLANNKKKEHWVIALDKATGNEVWKVARPSDATNESREAYTSPVLWQNGKELNLVILGCDYCTGHSLKDGKELWRLGNLNPGRGNKNNHRIIASPAASSDELIVPTCRGLHVVSLKPGATGFIKAGDSFEQWRIDQGAPDVSTPLILDGLVYLPQSNANVVCVDGKTGATLYDKTLTKGRYRASPVCADGHVYVVGRDSGVTTVLQGGPKFVKLADNHLPDYFTASPAISNGRIYLRGFKTLYAISEGGK